MNTIFYICVEIMTVSSAWLGITYEQFNVILFVFLHPAITLLLFILWIAALKKIKALRKALNQGKK